MTQNTNTARHNGHPLASGLRPVPQESLYIIIVQRRKIINANDYPSEFQGANKKTGSYSHREPACFSSKLGSVTVELLRTQIWRYQ